MKPTTSWGPVGEQFSTALHKSWLMPWLMSIVTASPHSLQHHDVSSGILKLVQKWWWCKLQTLFFHLTSNSTFSPFASTHHSPPFLCVNVIECFFPPPSMLSRCITICFLCVVGMYYVDVLIQYALCISLTMYLKLIKKKWLKHGGRGPPYHQRLMPPPKTSSLVTKQNCIFHQCTDTWNRNKQ